MYRTSNYIELHEQISHPLRLEALNNLIIDKNERHFSFRVKLSYILICHVPYYNVVLQRCRT